MTLVGDHRRGCLVWGAEGKGQAAADQFFAELDPPPAEARVDQEAAPVAGARDHGPVRPVPYRPGRQGRVAGGGR
ncbi:MAG: hypothetical protein ACLP22_00690 [Solirubrobacteraceae bacterium]